MGAGLLIPTVTGPFAVRAEAMHALGVPTTRALSLVATGDQVGSSRAGRRCTGLLGMAVKNSLIWFACGQRINEKSTPGLQVMRDMFYNGNARLEPGAVVCRVSKSFVRFGSFQLPVTRCGEVGVGGRPPAEPAATRAGPISRAGAAMPAATRSTHRSRPRLLAFLCRGKDEMGMVGLLADYVIRHHYPHLQGEPREGWAGGGALVLATSSHRRPCCLLARISLAHATCPSSHPSPHTHTFTLMHTLLGPAGGPGNKYAAFLAEVAQRTARLVAEWHRVGFVHGVLNTDNMSILGETIGGLGRGGGGSRWCAGECIGGVPQPATGRHNQQRALVSPPRPQTMVPTVSWSALIPISRWVPSEPGLPCFLFAPSFLLLLSCPLELPCLASSAQRPPARLPTPARPAAQHHRPPRQALLLQARPWAAWSSMQGWCHGWVDGSHWHESTGPAACQHSRLLTCLPLLTNLPLAACREQPEIGQWNLVQLARALVVAGLLSEEEAAPALAAYAETLTQAGLLREAGLAGPACRVAPLPARPMRPAQPVPTSPWPVPPHLSCHLPLSHPVPPALSFYCSGMMRYRRPSWACAPMIARWRAACCV